MSGQRVTGGTLRGRVVSVPVAAGVRPTGDRVREALFSIVGQGLSGVRFLDAFAGTGLVAIEAASRGADVTAIERDPAAARDVRARLAALELRDVELRIGDTLALAASLQPYQIVFADPPWSAPIAPILDVLAPIAAGTLVLEAEAGNAVPEVAGALKLDRSRAYGRTSLHVYRG